MKKNEKLVLVATVPTVYGIETQALNQYLAHRCRQRCNSTYRLRY